MADSNGISRVPPYSGVWSNEIDNFRIRGYHPLWPELSWTVFLINYFLTHRDNSNHIPQPQHSKLCWFRLFPFRSPLLRKSLLFSFPAGTEMFHFPALALIILYIQIIVVKHYFDWVVPFGDPRLNGCLHLTEAYRSLPRPSSPSNAKASAVRP